MGTLRPRERSPHTNKANGLAAPLQGKRGSNSFVRHCPYPGLLEPYTTTLTYDPVR